VEGTATRLGLSDLSERYRLPIVGALRRELVERCLTADETADLAIGATDLPHVVARALLRAVAALEHDQSVAAVAAVCDLADLLDLQGLHIPFDVQTELYRLRANAPRDVARRLGFAEGA
jgi:hypothetical protein